MRVLIRSYDLDDGGGSGTTLRTVARYLAEQGDAVWATNAVQTRAEIMAWKPDVIIGQQWATEEASRWAATLSVPFIMFVHGPGQYEQFMPLCDLVLFCTREQLKLAQPALGATPAKVLYLPVLCTDDETDGAGTCLTVIGSEPIKGVDKFIELAQQHDPRVELAEFREDLKRLATAGRRRPTLTLCMTVANEAPTLEKAVHSVAPYVDEIIIGVDLKSADETAAIAQRLATDYFEFTETSPPDFPRMRNRAMERVKTDWAIVLDGHEWIEHAELIRPALETTAWSLEIQTLYEPDENRVPGLSFAFPRIHRRHVRFVGASAHEEVSTPSNRRDTCLNIKVWHERKPGVATTIRNQEKTGKELEALFAAWQERGDRRALFYFANGLREADRYDEAINAYEEYLKKPNFAEEGWQALLYLARCHTQKHAWPPARRLFEQAIIKYPERAEAAVGLGYVLLEMGEIQAAAAWFRMASSLPEPTHFRLFVETPVYRWGAWHGLALAMDRLGDYTSAIEAETRAQSGGAGAWAQQNIHRWQTNYDLGF